MDKISVIMPAYNCADFMPAAVKSVQRQSYKNWELIIVDDASTDGTLTVAEKLAEADSRIKVFGMKENGGAGVCRNLAISKAEGRFLAFLDSDDVWMENKLQHQYDFMRAHDIALSHTSYVFMDEAGRVMEKGKVDVDFEVDLPKYMKTTQIGMSSVMIDRQKTEKIHFPEDRELSEDARVWMALLRKGNKFYGLNEALVLYRVRANQLSRNKLKMAQSCLKRYWNEKNLPAYKRMFYFIGYAYNGFRKRLDKNKQLNLSELKDYSGSRR